MQEIKDSLKSRSESRPSRGGCRGTSVVEAAVVMLLFLSILFGVLESGRFMSIQQTLTNAAREGARLAVAPMSQSFSLATDTEIQNRVSYFLQSNGIPLTGSNHASIHIDRNVALGSAEDVYTRVTVTYPYKVLSLQMFSDLEIALSGTSRMRNETSP